MLPPLIVDDVIKKLVRPMVQPLARVPYKPVGYNEIYWAFTVPSMKNHMTDEGWQIMLALQHAKWRLFGNGLDSREGTSLTDVSAAMNWLNTCPRDATVLIQDKREWDTHAGDFRNPHDRLRNVDCLKNREDVFKLTILKDAHQRPLYHRQSADEIDCNAWIIYYHPRIVAHLAPYVRPNDLIRTYHSVDKRLIEALDHRTKRNGVLMSGAVSGAYPLRARLQHEWSVIKPRNERTYWLPHPGYHRNGSAVKDFLQTMLNFKVAICTSSRYGYALRKIIEATACGCKVLTDLPIDEFMPAIDGNLTRINPNESTSNINELLTKMCETYDESAQHRYAEAAKAYYDYRAQGLLLHDKINNLRRTQASV